MTFALQNEDVRGRKWDGHPLMWDMSSSGLSHGLKFCGDKNLNKGVRAVEWLKINCISNPTAIGFIYCGQVLSEMI